MNFMSGMVKCPKCGSQYDISIHNWCPNCRVTYASASTKYWNNMVDDESWEVDIETISSCDKAPDEIKILIDPIVKGKIDYLMKKFVGTEWLAYLIGDGKNKHKVTDIFIPNQTVNSVNVKNVHCNEYNKLNVIGVIHSHHNMGNSFSHTDNEWINQNHDISLCISRSGINGHVRHKLPCGAYKIIDAKVIVNINSSFNTKEFDEIIDKKIKKETFSSVYIHNNIFNYNKRKSQLNGTTPKNDPSNPGNYHFTDNPVIRKNITTEVNNFKKELNNISDDHLSDEDIYKIGKEVFNDITIGIECDMKEE